MEEGYILFRKVQGLEVLGNQFPQVKLKNFLSFSFPSFIFIIIITCSIED